MTDSDCSQNVKDLALPAILPITLCVLLGRQSLPELPFVPKQQMKRECTADVAENIAFTFRIG